MSLINEALKQARVEAARQDAAGKGVPPEALPRYVPERRRSWLAPIVGFVAGLVAVGVAAGAFWMVRGPAQHVPEGRQAQHVPEVGQAPQAAESRQAEHAPGESQAQDASDQQAERRLEREPARQAQVAPAPQSPAQTPTPTESRSQTPAPVDMVPVETVPMATVPVETAPVASSPSTDGADGPSYLRQATLAGTTVKLDFIVWSENPFAQINGHLLSAGQSVDGYTLLEVERERVELEGGGERFWIRVK